MRFEAMKATIHRDSFEFDTVVFSKLSDDLLIGVSSDMPCLVIGRLGPYGLMRGLATSWIVLSSSFLTPCLKLAGMPRRMILGLSSVANSQRILFFWRLSQ